MLKIKPNPDKEIFEKVTDSVIENSGYCPCMIFKNEDTKCICKEFKEQKTEGKCRCGRYIKVEESETYYPENDD